MDTSAPLWSGRCYKLGKGGYQKRWVVVKSDHIAFYRLAEEDTRQPTRVIPRMDVIKVERSIRLNKDEFLIEMAVCTVTIRRSNWENTPEEWNRLHEVLQQYVIPWGGWSKVDHKRFPERTRREIWHFLLLATFYWRAMPRDLRYVVIGFIATR